MKGVAVILAGGLVMGGAAAANVSREQAEAFQKKLTQIVQHGESNTDRTQETIVTEGEVNSYLRFNAGNQLPVGVTEPSLSAQGQGRLSGRAVVDLDVIRKQKGTGGWFDLTSYLTGRLPLTAHGILRAQDGKGRFELGRAEVNGIPIPKSFLQEIVSYYTRTADHPTGLHLDQVFDLPADIRSIDVEPGRAVIVQ